MNTDVNIPKGKMLILFDGDCLLCNGSVQFIIKRDTAALFVFASLQSAVGQKVLHTHGLDSLGIDSFVFIDNTRAYIKSDAVFKIAGKLPWLWKLVGCCILVPKFIRDCCYDCIARNRFKFFDKHEQCWIGNSGIEERILRW